MPTPKYHLLSINIQIKFILNTHNAHIIIIHNHTIKIHTQKQIILDAFLILKTNKSLRRIVLLAVITTPFVMYLQALYQPYFQMSHVPGPHFDEAWQGLFINRILNEPGFFPTQAMNSYTTPVFAFYPCNLILTQPVSP
jgi:hypothetical protein